MPHNTKTCTEKINELRHEQTRGSIEFLVDLFGFVSFCISSSKFLNLKNKRTTKEEVKKSQIIEMNGREVFEVICNPQRSRHYILDY